MAEISTPRAAVILGVPFHDVTMDETIAHLGAVIERRKPVYWATANLDFTYQASKDVELQRILVEADLVLCDGTPLVWASRALGAPLRERVTGSDFVPRLAREAAAHNWKLFLLGGGDDALPIALKNLREQHPGIQIDGYSPPYAKLLEMDFDAISQRVRAYKPDVLLVAFGCPKQEKWIYMHHRNLGVPMSVGVGATVDFLAGKFRRAPRWMQVIGAEWVFRLCQEPTRLFNRYLFDLLFFVRALRAQRRALSEHAPAHTASSAAPAPAPRIDPGLRVVVWQGRIDAAAIAEKRVPLPAEDLSPGMVVAIDTSGVTFIDSTGLGFLLSSYRQTNASGGGLVLVSPAVCVSALLDAMKLSRLIISVDDASRAHAALGLSAPSPKAATSALDLTLPLQAELTATRVPGLTRWIEESWESRPDVTRLVLDLSEVRFMDSSGLGLILRCHRMTATRPGGTLILRAPCENVRNVFALSKVDSLLKIE